MSASLHLSLAEGSGRRRGITLIGWEYNPIGGDLSVNAMGSGYGALMFSCEWAPAPLYYISASKTSPDPIISDPVR